MTLSKERLEEIAEDGFLKHGEAKEMARRLLAAEAQEPYGYVHKSVYESVGSCGLTNDHDAYRNSDSHIPLYTAPPAPVAQPVQVPDFSALDSLAGEFLNNAMNHNAKARDAYTWCAHRLAETVRDCRAAMLKGGK